MVPGDIEHWLGRCKKEVDYREIRWTRLTVLGILARESWESLESYPASHFVVPYQNKRKMAAALDQVCVLPFVKLVSDVDLWKLQYQLSHLAEETRTYSAAFVYSLRHPNGEIDGGIGVAELAALLLEVAQYQHSQDLRF